MNNKFTPTWMVNAIYELTPEKIKEKNIKVILTDLDNTLIAWNNPNGTKELREWLKEMQENQIPVIIVSNNSNKRVSRVAEQMNLEYLSNALKPSAAGINKIIKKLSIKRENVIFVGDQLLTDVYAANNAKIRSILVKPIIETDQWNTKINRFFEKKIKKNMLKRNPNLKWRNNIE